MSRSKQSTNLASISSTSVMELPVVLPPSEEQDVLLRFLEKQTSQFNTLTAQARIAITLLQERRTALISAAVTGQIDVRGLAGSANAPDSVAASAYPASARGQFGFKPILYPCRMKPSRQPSSPNWQHTKRTAIASLRGQMGSEPETRKLRNKSPFPEFLRKIPWR